MGQYTNRVTKEQFIEMAKNKGWVMRRDAAFLAQFYDIASRTDNPALDALMEDIQNTDIWEVESRRRLLGEISEQCRTKKLVDDKEFDEYGLFHYSTYDTYVRQQDLDDAKKKMGLMDAAEYGKRKYSNLFTEKAYILGWDSQTDDAMIQVIGRAAVDAQGNPIQSLVSLLEVEVQTYAARELWLKTAKETLDAIPQDQKTPEQISALVETEKLIAPATYLAEGEKLAKKAIDPDSYRGWQITRDLVIEISAATKGFRLETKNNILPLVRDSLDSGKVMLDPYISRFKIGDDYSKYDYYLTSRLLDAVAGAIDEQQEKTPGMLKVTENIRTWQNTYHNAIESSRKYAEPEIEKMKEDDRRREEERLRKEEEERKEKEARKAAAANRKANQERFDAESPYKGGAGKFKTSLQANGFGVFEHERFLVSSLYDAARDTGNPICISLLDLLHNADVHDAASYRKTMEDVTSQIRDMENTGDYYGKSTIDSLKKNAAKMSDVLAKRSPESLQKEIDATARKYSRKMKIEQDRQAAAALDATFVEQAKSMGWKEEDIHLLDVITSAQKIERESSYDQLLHAVRSKITTTPLTPEHYYSTRNALLTEALDSAKKSAKAILNKLRYGGLEDEIRKSEALAKGETHEQDKEAWMARARKAGWTRAGDEELLSAIYEGRKNIDGSVNTAYDKKLQKMVRPDSSPDHDRAIFMAEMVRELEGQSSEKGLTPAQHNALAELRAERAAFSRGFKLISWKGERTTVKPEEVIYPSFAEQVILQDVLAERIHLKKNELMEELNREGISLRVFAHVFDTKRLQNAQDLQGIRAIPQEAKKNAEELRNSLEGSITPLTARDAESVKKAEALLERWCAEKRKAYTALDHTVEENLRKEHEDFIAKARDNGWIEAAVNDTALINALSYARYDKDGQLIKNMDEAFRGQFQLRDVGYIDERRKMLEGYREAIKTVPEADRTKEQKHALNEINKSLRTCEKDGYLNKREQFVSEAHKNGWILGYDETRFIYDALYGRKGSVAAALLEEIRLGISTTYPEQAPKSNNGIYELQSTDILQRVIREISENPDISRQAEEKRLVEMLQKDIDLMKESAKEQEQTYRDMAAEQLESWEEQYGKAADVLPVFLQSDPNALDKAINSLKKAAGRMHEAELLQYSLKALKDSRNAAVKAEGDQKAAAEADLVKKSYLLRDALDTYLTLEPMKNWPDDLMNGIEKICPEEFARLDRKELFVNRYIEKGWEEERELFENLYASGTRLDGKPVEEGQAAAQGSYQAELDKLAGIRSENTEAVIESFKKLNTILTAVPEDQRTENQKWLLEAFANSIPQLEEKLQEEARNRARNERLLDRQYGGAIEAIEYQPDAIYPGKKAGQQKPHLWADPAAANATWYFDVMGQLTMDANLLDAQEAQQQLTNYQDFITRSKALHENPKGREYQEYNGKQPVKVGRADANLYVEPADQEWVKEKLADAARTYEKIAFKMTSREMKEFYYGYSFMAETGHGNYVQAIGENSYLKNLISTRIMGPKASLGLDNALLGLKGRHPDQLHLAEEQRPKDISGDYMTILNQSMHQLALEYERQALEREGWSDPYRENDYLEHLRDSHTKIVTAFDRLCAIDDNGQYDAYLDNPLNHMTERKFDPACKRGITVSCGLMRGELHALDLGYGARELGLMGMVGGIEGYLDRLHSQAAKNPECEAKTELDAAKDLERDFIALKDKVWTKDILGLNAERTLQRKKEVADQIGQFMDKYKNHPALANAVISGYRDRYDEARLQIEADYRKSLGDADYRRLSREEFDRSMKGYEAVADLAKKSQDLFGRFAGLHREDHRDSDQYTAMKDSVDLLQEIGMSGSMKQYMDTLNRIENSAKAYQSKLKINEGLIGNGKKRLDLSKELVQFVKEERKLLTERIGKEFGENTPICEQMHRKAVNAPERQGERNFEGEFTSEYERQNPEDNAARKKTSLFEIMDPDDKETRLAKVESLENREREKRMYQEGLEQAKQRHRNRNRINAAELNGDQNQGPANAHPQHQPGPQPQAGPAGPQAGGRRH